MCILLVKKLESMLFCVRVNIVSGDNYPTVPLVTDNIGPIFGCSYCSIVNWRLVFRKFIILPTSNHLQNE